MNWTAEEVGRVPARVTSTRRVHDDTDIISWYITSLAVSHLCIPVDSRFVNDLTMYDVICFGTSELIVYNREGNQKGATGWHIRASKSSWKTQSGTFKRMAGL